MRSLILLLILLTCLACHGSPAKSKVAVQKKAEQKPKAEYVGDNTAPLEIRALRDAHKLQKDMHKKQEQEKEILKERD